MCTSQNNFPMDRGTSHQDLVLSIATIGASAIIFSLVCLVIVLLCIFLCSRHRENQRRGALIRNRQNITTETGENYDEVTEETELHKVPPPNYSKAELYTTDENYDKEHHTYIRPVDSDDVFDNRSEPPAYESRVRMSIASRQSVVSSTHSSANDSDIDQPPRMRVPTEGELNVIEETNETERPTDGSQGELNVIEETNETERPTICSQGELNTIVETERPTDGELNDTVETNQTERLSEHSQEEVNTP